MLIHEASLYEQYPGGKVRCTACSRYCILADGQIGFCGIRKNEGGKLDLLAYGRPLATQIDPIEKKPILHRNQGYLIYSIGTAGCNFACQFCQNYDLSQRKQIEGSYYMSPEKVVENAIKEGCKGIAFTYNEPTIFTEYARDIGLIAHEKGLVNIFVSNGYETPESIHVLSEFLDSITVDFKGNANLNFYRRYMSVPDTEFIYDTLRELSKTEIHVEITDLVVPEIGDSLEDARKMIRRVKEICGSGIPVSFLRFHPDYKLMHLPSTPVSTLEDHYFLAKEEGMDYVYIGNVPGSRYQNTYCPKCGELCVARDMMRTLRIHLSEDGSCLNCGHFIGEIAKESDILGF